MAALRHLHAASLLVLLVVACKHRLDIRFKDMLANHGILVILPPLTYTGASNIGVSDASNDVPPRLQPQQAPLMAAAAVAAAAAGMAEDAASKGDTVVEAAAAAVGAMALGVWAHAWVSPARKLHFLSRWF
ncbi:unnamed protein product [Closterium sp. NIES-53]